MKDLHQGTSINPSSNRENRGWLEELTEHSARELERLEKTGAQAEAELYRRARALVLAHLESERHETGGVQ